MSTQPLSETTETQNTITKTVEIARTNPDITIPLTKFGGTNPLASLYRPLSYKYDIVTLLSNNRLYATWEMTANASHHVIHNLDTMATLAPYRRLLDFAEYISADLQITIKLTSNVQQVGNMRASLRPSHDDNASEAFLDVIYGDPHPSTFSWEIIDFGLNSEHVYTIPWMSIIPYYKVLAGNSQFDHGRFVIKTLVAHPIETVSFKPTVQVYIKYVNIQFAGSNVYG